MQGFIQGLVILDADWLLVLSFEGAGCRVSRVYGKWPTEISTLWSLVGPEADGQRSISARGGLVFPRRFRGRALGF